MMMPSTCGYHKNGHSEGRILFLVVNEISYRVLLDFKSKECPDKDCILCHKKKHLPSCNKQNALRIGMVTIRMLLLKNPTKQKPSYLVKEQSHFQYAVSEKNQTMDGQCRKIQVIFMVI